MESPRRKENLVPNSQQIMEPSSFKHWVMGRMG